MSNRNLYVLDQFLMRGGRLILMLDHRIQIPQFPSLLIPMKYGFNRLLNPFGLKIKYDGTVIDRIHHSQAPVTHPSTGAIRPVSHPGFARVQVLDKAHPITREMEDLVAPFASPIEVSRPLAPSVQHVVLAASHPTAVVHSNVRKVAPNAYLKPSNSDEETKAKAIVGLLATGSYTSIFSGKKIPLHPMKRNPLLGGTKTPERPFIERSQAQSKVLLITSGTRLLGAQKNGLIFLQNAVDYLMTETSLASLRARRFESPNLKKTNRNTRLWVRWGNVAGPTILLGLLGLVLRLRRGWST